MKTYTLEEIKELCEKAASVDWEAKDNPHSDFIYIIEAQYGDGHGEICRIDRGSNKAQGNADFIAASRTIVPQLVGQLEKAIEALTYYARKDDGFESYKGDISLAKEVLKWLGHPIDPQRWAKDQRQQAEHKIKLKELGVE